ncbi:DMT family transporter [Thermodesulfobacteriota bacterium]
MPVELIAISSAILFSISSICIRKGLVLLRPDNAILISLFINTTTLWILTFFFVPFSYFRSPGLIIFVISGLLTPGLARFIYYTGMEKIGVSIANPLKCTAPLFAALIAIILLKEKLTIPILFETILIVFGIIIISFPKGTDKKGNWKRIYILIPLLAAFLYGAASNLRKYGLSFVPVPILGATIGATTSLITMIPTVFYRQWKYKTLKWNFAILFFICSGFLNCFGVLARFAALNGADVIFVAPLLSIEPLFVLFFTTLFLKDKERLTVSTIIGAVAIVAGIVVASVFK